MYTALARALKQITPRATAPTLRGVTALGEKNRGATRKAFLTH
jgi:hypothetical protein